MKNLLSIDYGRQHVGIAVATSAIAEPLLILDRNNEVIKHIKRVCQENSVDTIIIGISEGEMAKETKAFAQEVKQATELKVLLQDETLTSYEAAQKLRHAKHSKRSQPQDAYQATLILQDYIDHYVSSQARKTDTIN